MTGIKESTLQALRLRYNAALAAQQGCARALSEASLRGALPDPALLEVDARARAELVRARAALLAAMTESITGHATAPECDEPPQPPQSATPPLDAS